MEWHVSEHPVDYPDAVAQMEAHVAAIAAGTADERIWLLEHPPLYTAGTSAKIEDLRDPRFPVYESGRGGQYTYHGPGQRVAYTMLELARHYPAPDIRGFVHDLEEWIIRSLDIVGIHGERRAGRIGIWSVDRDGNENKIAALGIRVRRGVSYHGISINVNPDLSHFDGIVPCGISAFGVTSITRETGQNIPMDRVDAALKQAYSLIFM